MSRSASNKSARRRACPAIHPLDCRSDGAADPTFVLDNRIRSWNTPAVAFEKTLTTQVLPEQARPQLLPRAACGPAQRSNTRFLHCPRVVLARPTFLFHGADLRARWRPRRDTAPDTDGTARWKWPFCQHPRGVHVCALRDFSGKGKHNLSVECDGLIGRRHIDHQPEDACGEEPRLRLVSLLGVNSVFECTCARLLDAHVLIDDSATMLQ